MYLGLADAARGASGETAPLETATRALSARGSLEKDSADGSGDSAPLPGDAGLAGDGVRPPIRGDVGGMKAPIGEPGTLKLPFLGEATPPKGAWNDPGVGKGTIPRSAGGTKEGAGLPGGLS